MAPIFVDNLDAAGSGEHATLVALGLGRPEVDAAFRSPGLSA